MNSSLTEDYQARKIKERAALDRSMKTYQIIREGDELQKLKEGCLLLERIQGYLGKQQSHSARRISSSLANLTEINSSNLVAYESARVSRDIITDFIAETLDEIDFIYFENK